MEMLSYPQQNSTPQQNQNQQQPAHDPQNAIHQAHHVQQQQQQQQQPAIQTMRLRDAVQPVTSTTRSSRKRKSPPSSNTETAQTSAPPPQQQPTQQQPMQHVLPPPHALIHPHPIPGPLPPGYQYATADYTPGGLPPAGVPPPPGAQHQGQSQSPPPGSGGRALSSSKRAEQNRKAQRAFRERRDQHVKALESRSQLLDAALASADEANRRWEECRALVDQLRVENAALRAALSQAQLLPQSSANASETLNNNGGRPEEPRPSDGPSELKSDSTEVSSGKKD